MRKHDFEIAEMCWENVRLLSKMTSRLRADVTGESVMLLDKWMTGLLSLESCCGRPLIINSVLEGLRESWMTSN